MPDRDHAQGGTRRFESTCWTAVLAARHRGSPEARQGLEELCRTYWYPIYAFIRRWGHTARDTEDLTQEYFIHRTRPLSPTDRPMTPGVLRRRPRRRLRGFASCGGRIPAARSRTMVRWR